VTRSSELPDRRTVVLRTRRETFRNSERVEAMLVTDAIERLRVALQPLTERERRRAIVAVAAVFGDIDLVRAITMHSIGPYTPTRAVSL
jgi:hypothetical protein